MRKQITQVLSFVLLLLYVSICRGETTPFSVNIATVETSNYQPKIQVTGKLVAKEGIVIKSEIPGRISNIYFHSGENVRKNSILLSLNSNILDAEKKLLDCTLQLKKVELKRKKELYNKHALSKSELDEAITSLKSAEAKIEEVDAKIQQTRIKSPFSGTLGLRKVSIGDYITPTNEIVNLQSTDPVEVDFDVPQNYLNQIRPGIKISIHTEYYPDDIFYGQIIAREAMISPKNQSISVRGVLFNTKNKLLPGAFVNINIYFSSEKKEIIIPQTAIIYSSNGNYVYTTDSEKAYKTRVILGDRADNNIIVKTGLSPGDKIVTIGSMKLFDGAPIRAVVSPQNNHEENV